MAWDRWKNERDKNGWVTLTVEAYSSPMKRPSLILMAPIISFSIIFAGMGIYCMGGCPALFIFSLSFLFSRHLYERVSIKEYLV